MSNANSPPPLHFSPAVVIPPWTWVPDIPAERVPYAPLKKPVIVPEGDTGIRPVLPLECGPCIRSPSTKERRS
ncbi:hypothetical protein [Pandoraea oxalativorans]|uniref:hypothetical protein n=1 Tax=Pandoraea oxalativorans TaxID=573737 RepID=UPI0012F4E251|nr:hypothetical protein [Pandoraea oxalativorans]